MTTIDPEQERRRLAEFYSRRMDGQLERVAKEAYDLTDIAREVLREEFARRGLDVQLAEFRPVPPAPPALLGDPPPEPSAEEASAGNGELELRKMITIRQFRDLPEALLAKGSLDSAGIECALVDDNMVRMDWFISNFIGGVKLQVQPDEVEAAIEVLDQPIPEGFDVAGVGQYQQPHCPRCQSLDVNFQEVAPAAFLTTMVSMPIPFHRRAWRCHSCDAEWEDDGVPETPESTA